MGLVKQALARIPHWAIHKLTKVYVSLSLGEIAQAIKSPDPLLVRALIQTMVSNFHSLSRLLLLSSLAIQISTGEIHATVSPSGIVKFEDAPVKMMSEPEGERMLSLARAQCLKLMELDRQIAKSKPYLSAVGLSPPIICLLLKTKLAFRLCVNGNITLWTMAALAIWARKLIIRVHLVSKRGEEWAPGTKKCRRTIATMRSRETIL